MKEELKLLIASANIICSSDGVGGRGGGGVYSKHTFVAFADSSTMTIVM